MKKDNKGFSLIELIVVIAIMVVLIAVLGSTVLGYVEKANYAKDIQALDAVNTALDLYVIEPKSVIPDDASTTGGVLLSTIMDEQYDVAGVIAPVLRDTFGSDNTFDNSSEAFEGIDTGKIKVWIKDGAVAIRIPAKGSYADYVSGEPLS